MHGSPAGVLSYACHVAASEHEDGTSARAEHWKSRVERHRRREALLQATSMPGVAVTATCSVPLMAGAKHVRGPLTGSAGTPPPRRVFTATATDRLKKVPGIEHVTQWHGTQRDSAAGTGTPPPSRGGGRRGVRSRAAQGEEGGTSTEGVPERGPPHKVLGVSLEASADEIRDAFRAKVCASLTSLPFAFSFLPPLFLLHLFLPPLLPLPLFLPTLSATCVFPPSLPLSLLLRDCGLCMPWC